MKNIKRMQQTCNLCLFIIGHSWLKDDIPGENWELQECVSAAQGQILYELSGSETAAGSSEEWGDREENQSNWEANNRERERTDRCTAGWFIQHKLSLMLSNIQSLFSLDKLTCCSFCWCKKYLLNGFPPFLIGVDDQETLSNAAEWYFITFSKKWVAFSQLVFFWSNTIVQNNSNCQENEALQTDNNEEVDCYQDPEMQVKYLLCSSELYCTEFQ